MGLSQRKMAESLGLTGGYWSTLESGGRNISETALLLLEAKFKVDVQWVLHGQGEMLTKQSTPENGYDVTKVREMLDQAIKREEELGKELEEERKKRIPDLGRYERNKASIEYLRESHPEYEIDPEAEEEFCMNFGGFLGGVSSKGIMGVLERIKRRKRYHDILDAVFGYEPELAERLQTLLEQPGGVDTLKEYFGITEENSK